MRTLINKLYAIWYVLTTKEFMFIRIQRTDREKKVGIIFRTNDNMAGDVDTLDQVCNVIKQREL